MESSNLIVILTDFAGDVTSRHSNIGYVIFLYGNPVAWYSQKQCYMSLSKTESEYIAASEGVKELVWLLNFHPDIMSTNVEANVSEFPDFHKRTKHIEVKYHYVREKFESKLFSIMYVPSAEQLADMLTKAIPRTRFATLKLMMGIK